MSALTTTPLPQQQSTPESLALTLRRFLAELLGAGVFSATTLVAGWLAAQGLIAEPLASVLVPGLTILLLIYALSDVSGAHFSPAMTLAFALRGSFPWKRVPLYWAAQILGGLLAARVLALFFTLPHALERVTPLGAFWLEGAVTLLLVTVILATADRKASVGINSALAVAVTLSLGHLLVNPLTALSLNPARVLGVYLVDGRAGIWPHLWGPFLGAVLAVGLTWALRGPLAPESEDAAQGEQGKG